MLSPPSLAHTCPSELVFSLWRWTERGKHNYFRSFLDYNIFCQAILSDVWSVLQMLQSFFNQPVCSADPSLRPCGLLLSLQLQTPPPPVPWTHNTSSPLCTNVAPAVAKCPPLPNISALYIFSFARQMFLHPDALTKHNLHIICVALPLILAYKKKTL